MKESAPIITGLLAYGMSGRIFHAPFLTTSRQFKLKAVVERTQKKIQRTYAGIQSYGSVEEILSDNEIELIVVNTPSFTHFDFAKRVLQSGKHVLIEKPAAGNVKEIKQLFNLGRQVGKQVLVYQNRRWDSDFLSVKHVIASGKLGKLAEVTFRYDRYRPDLAVKAFKETRETPLTGIGYELGPHLVDQAIALFGKPLTFDKVLAFQRNGTEVPDYINVRMVYPNGLIVNLISGLLILEPVPSFVVHGALGSYYKQRLDLQEVELDEGMLPTDPQYGIEPAGSRGKLVTISEGGEKKTEWVPSLKGNYAGLFSSVFDAIRNGVKYPVTEEQVIWQLEILGP